VSPDREPTDPAPGNSAAIPRDDAAAVGSGPAAGAGRPGESIRRELAAILVLYLLLAAIPLIMGLSCGGAA
jgi:hypothetical protein